MGLDAFNNAGFTLHRVQIEDRQSDVFWHLGEVFAKKSKPKLGQNSPKCFMQMLEANTDQSEESIPWSLKMGCSRIAHSISWMPCASIPWCEGSDSQQMIAASSAVCLHKEAHPCDGNAESVLPPSVSQLLVPIFLNLLITTGSSRAAGAEWSWDLKLCWELWGRRNSARCITGRSRSTDRSSQILALRKLSDHQELCKADTAMWETISDSNVDVRPPCDSLQNNPCHVHVIWVRIFPKGLFQMRALILACLRLVYLIVSVARCLQAVDCVLFTCCSLEVSVTGSVPCVLATRKSHENISYFRIGKT